MWACGGGESLEALPRLLPLTLKFTECEPLQPENAPNFQRLMENRYLPKSKLIRKLYYKLGGAKIAKQFVEENRHLISSHTIMAIYKKAGVS